MNELEARQQTKARHAQYRQAAAVLYPGLTICPEVTVNETASRDGAFVEGTVFVSMSECNTVASDEPTRRQILKSELIDVLRVLRARMKRGGGTPRQVNARIKHLDVLIKAVRRDL